MPIDTFAYQDSASDSRQSRPCVALAGNPNCGKTSLFNVLSGSRYKVANYPGVTVEKKEAKISLGDLSATLVDLPGMYSLAGDSLDEEVASRTLTNPKEKPELIICVVDTLNLERNLFLVTQIMDLGLPVIVALNMIDLAHKEGLHVRTTLLSRLLDLPVVAISTYTKEGLAELKSEIVTHISKGPTASSRILTWQNYLTDTSDPEDEVVLEATARYKFIREAIKKSVSYQSQESKKLSERLDSYLLHPIWGLLSFALIMAILFQAIFTLAAYPMDLIDSGVTTLSAWLSPLLPNGELKSLVLDGILAGVGSVIIFIPQIAFLCLLITLLEDSGYLCRAAAIMDKIMRKVGLQGRSFVPLLSSFACAIPGMMATRTIPSFRDRLTTILVAPLMSCSARLPVYALLVAAFVPKDYFVGIFSYQGLTLLGLYLLGIITAAGMAFLLKLSVLKGSSSHFVMEMPPYRVPILKNALRATWDKIYLFLRDAGSLILACSIVIWYLTTHPARPEYTAAERVQHSYAADIGHLIEPAIEPLGYDWKMGVGILSSFAAREVFVTTLATIYSASDSENSTSLITSLQNAKTSAGEPRYTLPVALSLMVFFAYACQCISTLAVCYKETGSWKWPAFVFIYMTTLAYVGAFTTYRTATWFAG